MFLTIICILVCSVRKYFYFIIFWCLIHSSEFLCLSSILFVACTLLIMRLLNFFGLLKLYGLIGPILLFYFSLKFLYFIENCFPNYLIHFKLNIDLCLILHLISYCSFNHHFFLNFVEFGMLWNFRAPVKYS